MAVIGIDASRAVTAQRTGTEAYAYFLIQALIPLAAERGHQLRLYFNQPPLDGLFPVSDHVEIVTIPFARLWTHLRLAWELHRRPPDIFFTPAHVIPLTYDGRSAATIHDLGYHYFPEAHPQSDLRYLKWSTRHNAKRSHTIIADSQATKDDLIKWDGIPADKIEVVYPGIDPALRRVEDEERITAVLAKHNIQKPYLLYISTIQPRKNLERLIDAYLQSGVPYQLVLAGKIGWLSDPIVNKLSNLDPHPSPPPERGRGHAPSPSEGEGWGEGEFPQPPVPSPQPPILTDFIPDTEKAALLSGATALLYPSLYEGFGFPILEAQACGVPVLTANTSSCGEVAGDTAVLVNPLDTNAIAQGIQQIVTDDELRQTLVQKGLANVQKYSWEDTAVNILNILEAAIQKA